MEKCVHCLTEVDSITDDHVFPDGWYPDDTPSDCQRWTVPSCDPCNGRYSKVEDRLLTRLIMGFHPLDPRVKGLPQKMKRSLNPFMGKTIKDSLARIRKKQSILGKIIRFAVPPTKGVIPGFGPEVLGTNRMFGDAFLISKEDIDAFGEKLVKGSIYKIDGKYVERTRKIETNFVKDEDAKEVLAPFVGRGEVYQLCPAFGIWRLMPDDGDDLQLFVFRIWDRLNLFSSVGMTESAG